jgi:hypothetical protein
MRRDTGEGEGEAKKIGSEARWQGSKARKEGEARQEDDERFGVCARNSRGPAEPAGTVWSCRIRCRLRQPLPARARCGAPHQQGKRTRRQTCTAAFWCPVETADLDRRSGGSGSASGMPAVRTQRHSFRRSVPPVWPVQRGWEHRVEGPERATHHYEGQNLPCPTPPRGDRLGSSGWARILVRAYVRGCVSTCVRVGG